MKEKSGSLCRSRLEWLGEFCEEIQAKRTHKKKEKKEGVIKTLIWFSFVDDPTFFFFVLCCVLRASVGSFSNHPIHVPVHMEWEKVESKEH